MKPVALRSLLASALLVALLPGARALAQRPPGASASPSPGQRWDPWSRSPAVGLVPLEHGSGTPASVFRLGYLPQAPVTLSQGQWDIHNHVDWANYFCDGGDRYFIDYESVRYMLGAAYGLTNHTQLGFGATVSYQGGGVLDSLVETFERWVGATNQDRLRYPRGRYLVRMRDREGAVHEISRAEGGWHVEGIFVQVMQQLLNGTETRPSVVASGVLRFPIASDVPGRPAVGLDVGASLGLGQRLGRFNLYGGFGLVHFGTSRSMGVELEPYQATLSLALEYRASERTSVFLQILRSGPVARHLGELSKPVREVAVGVKRRVGRDVLLELSAEENVLLYSNSADIAFHMGLVWRPRMSFGSLPSQGPRPFLAGSRS